jgi:hypothetical protein
MTALETAQNPQTAPATLQRLGSSRDAAVRRAVARNPNTPEAALRILAALHPEALLKNPILEWLRFENPAWFAQLPDFARQALLKQPNCPTAWLESTLHGEPSLQLAALQNPNLLISVRLAWISHDDPRVSEGAVFHVQSQLDWTKEPIGLRLNDHPMTPPQLESHTELFKDMLTAQLPIDHQILQLLVQDFDPELRTLLAQRPDLPESLLETLALDEDEAVATAAKHNRFCEFAQCAANLSLNRPKDLMRLARGQGGARVLAAKHASISQNLLKKLATDDDWRVRQAVAANPKTPALTLKKLATDFDRDVRQAVAANPSTPSPILAALLSDSHEEVTEAARTNPATSPEVLVLLRRLEDKDPSLHHLESLPVWMQSRVAAHPNASAALLETLAKSDNSAVRMAVAKNPNTPLRLLENLLEDPDTDVQVATLERPHLPEALLQKLAAHADSRVLEATAQHPELSKALLEQLAQDGNWLVRRNVAAHPRCPIHLLEQLAKDPDPDVREACIRQPRANALVALHALGVELRLPEVLHQLEAHDPNLSSTWLEFVARRGNDLAKRLIASHPNLGTDIMHWLVTHDQWQVRAGLTQNPNLAPGIFETLYQDPDPDVRSSLAKHPQTPPAVLEKLLTDPDQKVRLQLVRRGFALDKLCWDEDEDVLAEIPVQHLGLRRRLENGEAVTWAELQPVLHLPMVLRLVPQDLSFDLTLALQHDHWQVRQAAVRNLHCTTEQLHTMIQDPDRDVRLEVLRHPNVTSEMVNSLMRDPDLSVRRAALSHPKLEPVLRQTAQRYILDESLRSSTLNRIVALGLTTRISELQKRKNYQSLEWRERLAVAQNPHTPKPILEKLTQDANCIVRVKAYERLEP